MSKGRLQDADVPANYVAQLSSHKNLQSLDSHKSASSLLHQQEMSLILSRSEQMECTTNTTTSNELAISTASGTTTKPSALISPPSTPGVASAMGLFYGATIGNIEGCSFTSENRRNATY